MPVYRKYESFVMQMSCVHPVAVLSAALCMTSSLFMLVEDARGSKRHSLHAVSQRSGKPCANCVAPSRPSNGGPIIVFGQAGHADPLDGWQCSL